MIYCANAGVTQLVESQPSKLLVAGSNPVSRSVAAHVAQSVEHILGKDEVTGSIPVVGFTESVRWEKKNWAKVGSLTVE